MSGADKNKHDPPWNGERHFDELTAINNELVNLQREMARKNAELAAAHHRIQASERQFRSLSDCLPVGVLELDVNGRCSYANSFWQTLTGLSAAESVGEGWKGIIHPDDNWILLEGFAEVIRSGQEFVSKARLLSTSGDERHVHCRAAALRSDTDETLKCVVVFEDVTESDRLETELARSRDEAVAASRAKAQFLITMSHEIRTPLNAIIGFSTLLLDTQLSSDQLEYLQAMRTAADALLGQVNTILDLSKIEASKLVLQRLPTDLRLAMEDALEILIEAAGQNNLNLTCLLAPDCPTHITSDPGRLRQVLINLVGNAVKFTQKGEIVVRALRVGHGLLQQVRIEVTDTGPGIAAQEIPKLFQPFSQLDATTSQRYGGSGLGLSLCQRLVAALGGSIGVESRLGLGSTFWLTLPLLPDETVIPERPALPACTPGPMVLVVDDHAASREQLGQLLQQVQLRPILCESAASVRAALHLNADLAPAVALVANTLPDADAETFAAELRRWPQLKNIHIVRLLPLNGLAEASLRLSEAFAAQIIKPIRAHRLLRILQAVLGSPSHPGGIDTKFGASSGQTATLELPPPRVLVAEDNPANLRLTELMLQRLGCRADLVSNGREAVSAASRFPYDLILMDSQMLELDGITATHQIRKLPFPGCTVPIVALTAHAFTTDRDRHISAGMNDFLSKPVTFDMLHGVLRRWLPRHFPPETRLPSADGWSTRSAASDAATALQDDVADIRLRLEQIVTVLGREAAENIMTLVKADWPKTVGVLDASMRAADLQGLSDGAHYLGGSALQLGAKGLVKLCKQLETAAKNRNPQDAATLLAAVGGRIQSLLGAL